jgi:hypothetical protein
VCRLIVRIKNTQSAIVAPYRPAEPNPSPKEFLFASWATDVPALQGAKQIIANVRSTQNQDRGAIVFAYKENNSYPVKGKQNEHDQSAHDKPSN